MSKNEKSREKYKDKMGKSLKDLLLQKQVSPPAQSAQAVAALTEQIRLLEAENQSLKSQLEASFREEGEGRISEEIIQPGTTGSTSVDHAFEQAVEDLKAERLPEAMEILAGILFVWPDHIRARINLAVVHAAMGEEDRAIVHLNRVLEQEPENETALRNLAILKPELQEAHS